MKKENKLFEVINDIDGKYIHEAGYEKVEESYAEEIQSVGRSKIRFAPAARIAACLALVGAVAVPAVIFSSGNSLGMTPYQSGGDNAAVEGTTDFSEENAVSDPAEGNDPSDDEEETNWLYIFDRKNNPYSDAVREEIEAGIKEWNKMAKDYPADMPTDEINFVFSLSEAGSFATMFASAPEGTEVRAVADGRVIFAGEYTTEKFGAKANIILIEHNSCVYTSYMWLDDNMYVEAGDDVVRGQAIGSALRSPLKKEGSGVKLGVYSHAPEDSYDFLMIINEFVDNAYLVAGREELIKEWSKKDLITPVENVPDGFEFITEPLLTGGNSIIFIPAEKGTEIRTIDDGEVVYAGFYNGEHEDRIYPGRGNLIAVKHNDAVCSVYFGVSDDIKVKTGDTLTAGQVIGYSDSNPNINENGFAFLLKVAGDGYQYVFTDYNPQVATMLDDAEGQTDTLSENNFVTVIEKAEEDQEQKTEEEQEPLS